MIRFVDLSEFYWNGDDEYPCCAFVDTTNGLFIAAEGGSHVCHSAEDVDALPARTGRCAGLVPEGFWSPAEKNDGAAMSAAKGAS